MSSNRVSDQSTNEKSKQSNRDNKSGQGNPANFLDGADDDDPPPPYGEEYGVIENEADGYGTRATLAGPS